MMFSVELVEVSRKRRRGRPPRGHATCRVALRAPRRAAPCRASGCALQPCHAPCHVGAPRAFSGVLKNASNSFASRANGASGRFAAHNVGPCVLGTCARARQRVCASARGARVRAQARARRSFLAARSSAHSRSAPRCGAARAEHSTRLGRPGGEPRTAGPGRAGPGRLGDARASVNHTGAGGWARWVCPSIADHTGICVIKLRARCRLHAGATRLSP